MDTTIINTVITAVSSIITEFLRLYIGKRDTDSVTMNKIREKQLSDLYTPLELCLNFNRSTSSTTILEDAEKILTENLELVPPELLKEFQKISRTEYADISRFKIATSSFYNWTRKYLGYPYDRAKIVSQFTPVLIRTQLLQKISKMLTLLACGGSVGSLISQLTLSAEEQSPVVIRVSLVILLVGIIISRELYSFDETRH